MINYNGDIQQTSPALSAKNRGFLYGDGVFDIVKYVEGSLFFVFLFWKWYNNRIYLFENQSFDNRAREKCKR